MKKKPVTLIVGGVLLLIFILLLFVFQVRQTEIAVVTTFGKPTGEGLGAGAHFRWPWPIQKVYKFDQRIHSLESQFEQVLTSDGYNLLIKVYSGWKISDPKLFFPAFGDSVHDAEEGLKGLVRNAYSSVVGKHPFSHFISTDRSELKFAEIEQQILKEVTQAAEQNQYGIEVEFLGVQKLGLPESVTALVFERMRSERQILVSQIESEGLRQASEIRSAANLESAKLLADADAEATRIRGQGAKESLKYFEVFEQNPELAKALLQLDTIEAFLKENSTLIFDQDTSPFHLLKSRSSTKD